MGQRDTLVSPAGRNGRKAALLPSETRCNLEGLTRANVVPGF